VSWVVRLHKEGLLTNALSSQLPADSSLALHLLVMIMGVAQTSVLCTAEQLGLRHVLTLSGKVHDE
jgi:hypothetical protein